MLKLYYFRETWVKMGKFPLNDVQKHKEFYGRNIEQMPKLIAEGRTPLSIAGLMKRRIEALNSPSGGFAFRTDNGSFITSFLYS